MEITEYLLTTDSFKTPTEVTGKRAKAVLITRLLLLEPGTNPLHPNMGVGIGSKYRFITTDDLPELKLRIEKQIAAYLPLLQGNQVLLEINNDNYLVIKIIVDSTAYVYNTYESETPVQLSDLNN